VHCWATVAGLSMSAFVVGAGLLALWIDARHPKLAPDSFSKRMGAAIGAMVVLQLAPVFNGSHPAVYATLFAILLPAFVCSFLTAVWLMRALRDAQLSH
jgi:hypothetical protein